MEYRTLIVVDGAKNLIECHLNLVDYSLRRGDDAAIEKFVDLQLEEHENRRLEIVIQDILKSRQAPVWNGDMHANGYSQKGIVREKPKADSQLVATGATWENNTLNFQFGRRTDTPTFMSADLPVLSCPFMAELRKLDDMTPAEKQKVLDVLELQTRFPFRFPQGDFAFGSIGRRLPSDELVVATALPPDSPLTHGWSAKPKRERAKLTMSFNGEDEPSLSPNGPDGCAYGNGNLTCPRQKKRSQIYCGHHLRLVSHKHQKNRAIKRSRSSVDFGDEKDVDYAGI